MAGTASGRTIAGFWIRGLAQAIDGAVAFAVGVMSVLVAVIILVAGNATGQPEAWLAAINRTSAMSWVVSFAGTIVYHTFCEYVGGATIGKLLCGLRVVSESFGPVSFSGALTRSAAIVVDAFLFGWIGYRAMESSPLAQRHGDRWGATAVVRTRMFPEAARGPGRVALGLGVGLFAWTTVLVCLFVAKALR